MSQSQKGEKEGERKQLSREGGTEQSRLKREGGSIFKREGGEGDTFKWRGEGSNFWWAGEVSARKAHKDPEAKLRSKRKVSFQDDQQREESERPAATPRSEWRPDQVAVAEGAKRQRREEEDAAERESKNTGGSTSSNTNTSAAGGTVFE